MDVEIVDEPSALAGYAREWDALAVATRRPVAAPGWLLAWLEHAGGERVRPHVVAVRDGGELVALAPFVRVRAAGGVARLRLMGAGVSAGVDVLARPGRERELAPLVRAALRGAADAIALEGIPAASPWPRLLGSSGLHAPRLAMRAAVPEVRLAGGSAAAWLASRSANFRQQMRAGWRRLEAKGARLRLTGAAELERDLAAFARLHHLRWDPRGGSGVLTPAVEAMLPAAARALLPGGRLRLWTLEADDEVISSHLFLAAGGAVTYWLGGFDPAWARERPTLAVLLRAIEDAFARGEQRLDLGAGGQDYKRRFATGEDALAWWTVPLAGPRLPLVLGDVAARRARRALRDRLRGAPA